MSKAIYLTGVIIILVSAKLFSQDTITLINGKQISALSVLDSQSTNIYYYISTKNNRQRLKAIDLLDVFSIKANNTGEKIIYKQDSILGYKLTLTEMSNYIKGEQHALKYYKSPWAFPVSFIAAPIAVNYMGYYGIISPAVVATAIGLKTPKLKNPENVSGALRNDINFIEGYRVQATKTKVKNAIFGGIAGIGVSLIILATFSK